MTAPIETPEPTAEVVAAYERHQEEYVRLWLDDRVMEPYLERFLEALDGPGEVLDVGCGPGRDVRFMVERGVGVVGVDLCEGFLATARRLTPEGTFRRMDVRRLGYPPETFAGVWASAVLHHLTAGELPKALAELARVLRPDGALAVAVEQGEGDYVDTWGRYRHRVTQDEFTGMLAAVGLRPCDEVVRTESRKGPLPPEGVKRWLNILARKTTSPPRRSTGEEGCLFCPDDRFRVNRQIGLAGAGSILWGDDSLFVIPDVAPLVEGHLLVVTTEHHLCYGAVGGMAESLRRVQRWVRGLFAETYGTPGLFVEHGPARCGEAGACVNHAHLHCLPLSLPLTSAVEGALGPGLPATAETLAELFRGGRSYVYVEETTDGGGVAFPADVVPSQLLRQFVVSRHGGRDWRWQTACTRPDAAATFRRALDRLTPVVDRAPVPDFSPHGVHPV